MRFYSIDEKTRIIISDDALNSLFNAYDKELPLETGGILLGKVSIDYSEYIITNACEISSSLMRTPTLFIRDYKKAQEVINNLWKNSNGIINYLGEWHTHPNMMGAPSSIDIKTISNIYFKIEKEIEKLFLVIIGGNKDIFIGVQENEVFKILKEGDKHA